MSEIIFYSTRNIFEEGSVSHPTISFRLAVQIALLERIGIDVSNVEQFRTKSTKQPSDDLTKTLLSLDIVPHIVDWIMEHECITNLISNWDSIFTTANQISEGKQPSAGLDMIFSALAYLAFDRSTAQEFELLREESLK